MNQYLAFPVFTLVAIGCASLILKLKKPEQIFLSAAIISAPWSGGVWVGPVQFDFRLSYGFLLVALSLLMGKPQRIKPKFSSTITIPVFILIFWTIVSASQAYDGGAAIGAGTLTYLFNFLYLFTIVKATKTDKDIDYMLKSLFLGLFLTVLLAVLQYKIRFFYVGFIDRGFSKFMWWRMRSTFHHPNAFGMYQLIVLPVLFREIINKLKIRDKKMGIMYIILFLLTCFTLYTTSNRGSWVGLAVSMTLIVVFDLFRKGGKKTRKVMLRVVMSLALLGIIGGVKYGPKMYERMFEGKNAVSNKKDSRAEYDVDAYIQIKAHPVTGVGVRNLRFYSAIIFTHNLYLLMMAETGYPGFFFFMWYFIGLLIESWKGTKSKNFYVSNINLGFLTSTIGLMIASYPGPDYGISAKVSSQIWIVAGIAIALNAFYEKSVKLQQLKKRQMKFQQLQQNRMRTEPAPVPVNGTGRQTIHNTSPARIAQAQYQRSLNGGNGRQRILK